MQAAFHIDQSKIYVTNFSTELYMTHVRAGANPWPLLLPWLPKLIYITKIIKRGIFSQFGICKMLVRPSGTQTKCWLPRLNRNSTNIAEEVLKSRVWGFRISTAHLMFMLLEDALWWSVVAALLHCMQHFGDEKLACKKFVRSKSAMRMDRMFADTESEEVESGIRVDMAEDMA